jgi:hypothetical protein
VLESTISAKRLPVSTFKDAVHLSPNDDYYLITDSEGNIGNMRFFRPIPEPQVTEPELLQENKNDIVGNKILQYHLKESSPFSASTSFRNFSNINLCIPLY